MKPRIAPAFIIGLAASPVADTRTVAAFVASLESIVKWLTSNEGKLDRRTGQFDAASTCTSADQCWAPLGVKHTPVILLTTFSTPIEQDLAQAFVRIAESKKPKLTITVRCVAPPPETVLPDKFESISPIFRRKKHPDEIVEQEPEHRARSVAEYVAMYSDLLLVFTEKALTPCADAQRANDASEIREMVEARLTGPRSGLLPHVSKISWADNGPVLNLFNGEIKDHKNGSAEQSCSAQFFYPYDCQPATLLDGASDRKRFKWEAEWAAAGEQSLRAVAKCFEQLNSETNVCSRDREEDAFLRMLPDPPKPQIASVHWISKLREWTKVFFHKRKPKDREPEDNEPQPIRTIPPVLGSYDRRLRSLAAVRRRVADLNALYDEKTKRLMNWMFCFAVLSVTAFQIYLFWTPASADAAPSPPPLYSMLAFFVGLIGVFAAWRVYLRSLPAAQHDRQNDYRALAEGLRVQFYWAAAGLTTSVAANYLLRGHREISWIRAAISSLAFPYDWNRQFAADASMKLRLERFQRIRRGWIDEQAKFFRTRRDRFGVSRARLTGAGATLLWAGVFLTIARFLERFPQVNSALHDFADAAWFRFWPLVFVSALLASMCLLHWICSRLSDSQSPRKSEACHWSDPGRWLQSWRARLVMGLVVAFAIVCCIYGMQGNPKFFPKAAGLLAIATVFCLAAGGLIHTWASMKFLSENIRRYSAMGDLFEGAQRRLEELLGRLESSTTNQATAPSSGCSHRAIQEETVEAIETLFLQLGKEALNENAEWLVMHRDRPLKPVNWV